VQVALLSYTHMLKLNIAATAYVNFLYLYTAEVYSKLTSYQAGTFLSRIISAGYLSPFKHACFTFHTDYKRPGVNACLLPSPLSSGTVGDNSTV